LKPAGALIVAALLSACSTTRPGDVVVSEGYLSEAAIAGLADALPAPNRTAPPPAVPDVPPGTDRWWLAIVHAESRAPEAAQHFDCALNVRFLARPRPALSRVMARLALDAEAASRRAADRHRVARPFAIEGGPTPCQRVTPAMRASPSWPAGGAAVAAVYGALMAELAPDRAAEARRIGQELGLSRAICRMNAPVDVEAGARLGQSLYAEAARDAAFADDLAVARAEVVAARAEGLTNPGCAAERRALGIRPDGG
jgi:acid phosphatase (class A)